METTDQNPAVMNLPQAVRDALAFLELGFDLPATGRRHALADGAVRRVASCLYTGRLDRLATWWMANAYQGEAELANVLHAACHAIARGFERSDHRRLPAALLALDEIEREVRSAVRAGRRCCDTRALAETA